MINVSIPWLYSAWDSSCCTGPGKSTWRSKRPWFNLVWVWFPAACGADISLYKRLLRVRSRFFCKLTLRSRSSPLAIPRPLAAGLFIRPLARMLFDGLKPYQIRWISWFMQEIYWFLFLSGITLELRDRRANHSDFSQHRNGQLSVRGRFVGHSFSWAGVSFGVSSRFNLKASMRADCTVWCLNQGILLRICCFCSMSVSVQLGWWRRQQDRTHLLEVYSWWLNFLPYGYFLFSRKTENIWWFSGASQSCENTEKWDLEIEQAIEIGASQWSDRWNAFRLPLRSR